MLKTSRPQKGLGFALVGIAVDDDTSTNRADGGGFVVEWAVLLFPHKNMRCKIGLVQEVEVELDLGQ